MSVNWKAVAALALLLSGPAFAAEEPGISATEIKIGGVFPFSGPASSIGLVGKGVMAYIQSVNDRGGINGRKINYIAYDDAYSPPKAVEHVRKLVESDEVSFMFGQLGTPGISATAKYLRSKGVPSIAIISGSSKFTDVANYPLTTTGLVSYDTEGKIYAKYLTKALPNAKYAILYQNDDYGKDYLKGFKDGLGAKAASMIVIEESYEVSAPTIDSHIVKMKSAGADVFFNITTPKFAAQAIKKNMEIGWKPLHFLNNVSASKLLVLEPAGLDKSQGLISTAYFKDPASPEWENDDSMMEFKDALAEYEPRANPEDPFCVFGWAAAQTMVEALKGMEEPTRKAIDQFELAVKLDPKFLQAFAKLAEVGSQYYFFFDRSPARLEGVRSAVDRAMRAIWAQVCCRTGPVQSVVRSRVSSCSSRSGFRSGTGCSK